MNATVSHIVWTELFGLTVSK